MDQNMETTFQNHDVLQENILIKKLAAVVRSIQWSYAIFWSPSSRQSGMLEWGAGYYNGDIKTRKTVQTQPSKFSVDQLGLQRSEHLRRLYESLSAGDSNQQSRRPSALLSPEDLTDTEWYYLVCMSFTFNTGQGLPGRVVECGHHIWLCNAHLADSKVFFRSLLAKSASIQTVVCFPLIGGVLELGVTELISEDLPFLQQVKTSFLEFSTVVFSEQSTSTSEDADDDEYPACTEVNNEMALVNSMPSDKPNSFVDCEMQTEDTTRFSDGSSNGCGPYQNTDDTFMLEGLNDASRVQSWQFMDDEHSCDCISQSFANLVNVVPHVKGENRTDHCLREKLDNHDKLCMFDSEIESSHYAKTLSTIFRNSQQLIPKAYFRNGSYESNFVIWRKDMDTRKSHISESQKMLKKILFEVGRMHNSFWLKTQGADLGGSVQKLDEDIGMKHGFLETTREKLTENLLTLKSLVPSISKVDQASILGDTIVYLKELERRVVELEACKEFGDEERQKRKQPDIVERTSDNYGHNEVASGKKPSVNKRKASNFDGADAELNWVVSKGNLADMTVTVVEKKVLIEMRCPWRECLLFEIVDAISTLHLDAHSVQSSTEDGILTLRLITKFRGAAIASVGMIKQALQRVVAMC